MRRASKSVVANIAEGYGRRASPKEFCRYLGVAVGSANEMEAHLAMAKVPGYVTETEGDRHLNDYQIVGRQLTRLIQYWKTRDNYSHGDQTPDTQHQSAWRAEGGS